MTPEFQHDVFLAPPGGPAAGAAVGGTAAGGGAEAKGRM